MTERSDLPITPQDAATIETYRERVHALYDGVRAWLADDARFHCEQLPGTVTEAIGTYDIDGLRVFADEQQVLAFEPVGAVVLLGAGLVHLWGTVDHAALQYFDSPTELFGGIVRPGWYWIDLRYDTRRFDRLVLFDVLQEVSDFERDGC